MTSEKRHARRVRSPRVVNVADLRSLARRRLPAVVFGYLDGGAEGEITLRENVRAFEDITFRPRQCQPVAECDLRTTVVGQPIALPIVLAPVGFSRMFFPQGELQACRAAHMAGTAYTLSSLAGMKLEDVAADRNGPLWYQLYVPGGRAVGEATIARARAAGYSIVYVPQARAIHLMGESSGAPKPESERFKQKHMIRSRLYIEEKYRGITAAQRQRIWSAATARYRSARWLP